MSSNIKIKSRYWKINIDKRIHSLMRELTIRKRPSTNASLSDQYESAISEYLQGEKIPKQIESITRTSIRFEVSDEFLEKVNTLRLIARKKRIPLPVLLEELCENYLQKPENYLGKPFYELHKRKVVNVK